jgi:hypothetical protein
LLDAGGIKLFWVKQSLMIEDGMPWQSMPFPRFKVVEVVRRCDLDGTGAELSVDEDGIADNWVRGRRTR